MKIFLSKFSFCNTFKKVYKFLASLKVFLASSLSLFIFFTLKVCRIGILIKTVEIILDFLLEASFENYGYFKMLHNIILLIKLCFFKIHIKYV